MNQLRLSSFGEGQVSTASPNCPSNRDLDGNWRNVKIRIKRPILGFRIRSGKVQCQL